LIPLLFAASAAFAATLSDSRGKTVVGAWTGEIEMLVVMLFVER
jgi:predicted LPLAT superfamily acyltransferase